MNTDQQTQAEASQKDQREMAIAQMVQDNRELKEINGDLQLSVKRLSAIVNQAQGQMNAANEVIVGLRARVEELEADQPKPNARRKAPAKKAAGKS